MVIGQVFIVKLTFLVILTGLPKDLMHFGLKHCLYGNEVSNNFLYILRQTFFDVMTIASLAKHKLNLHLRVDIFFMCSTSFFIDINLLSVPIFL